MNAPTPVYPAGLRDLLDEAETRTDPLVLNDLVALAHFASPIGCADPAVQAECAAAYKKAARRFRLGSVSENSDTEGRFLTTAAHIRSGVYLDFETETLNFKLDAVATSLRWTRFDEICLALNGVAEVIKAWVPKGTQRELRERRVLLERAYAIGALVLNTHNSERSRRHTAGEGPEDPSSPVFDASLARAEFLFEQFRDDADKAVARAAQQSYAKGMGIGCGLTIVLAAVLWGMQALGASIPQFYVVAGAMGSLGAVVSVFQRMAQAEFSIDVHAAGRLVAVLGGLRPVVGVIFGVVALATIRTGIVSFGGIEPTSWDVDYSRAAGLSIVIGFVSGFSERFAQDLLSGLVRKTRDDSEA